jgi:hypothetical protein
MSEHLSHERFARCFVESLPELEGHVRECPECSAELKRFGESVGQLRDKIRGRINAHVESLPVHASPRQKERTGHPKWQWALATATVVVVGLIPMATLDTRLGARSPKVSTEIDPSVLMDSINLHLSRDLPAPMEPMMVVFPRKESASGGVQ